MSSLLEPCENGSGYRFRSRERLCSFLNIDAPYLTCLARAPQSKNPPYCANPVNRDKAKAVDGLLNQLLVAVVPSDGAESLLKTLSTHVVCGVTGWHQKLEKAAEVNDQWQDKLSSEVQCAQEFYSSRQRRLMVNMMYCCGRERSGLVRKTWEKLRCGAQATCCNRGSLLCDVPARPLAKERWGLDLQVALRVEYGCEEVGEEVGDEVGEDVLANETGEEVGEEVADEIGDEDGPFDESGGLSDDDSFSGENVMTSDTTISSFGESQPEQCSPSRPQSPNAWGKVTENLNLSLATEESLNKTPRVVAPTSTYGTTLDVAPTSDGDESQTTSAGETLGSPEEAEEWWEVQDSSSDGREKAEVEENQDVADQQTDGSLDDAYDQVPAEDFQGSEVALISDGEEEDHDPHDETIRPTMEADGDQESGIRHQADTEDNQDGVDSLAKDLTSLSLDIPDKADAPQGLPPTALPAAPAPASAPCSRFREYSQKSPLPQLKQLMSIITETVELNERHSGYIYGFTWPSMPGYVKIGVAQDKAMASRGYPDPVDKRLAEWRGSCGEPFKEVFRVYIPCQAAKRIESLVHLTLRQYRRIQDPPCQRCEKRKQRRASKSETEKGGSGGQHDEWFEVETQKAKQVVEQWASFAKTLPYDSYGRLGNYWTKKIDAEKRRIGADDTIESWLVKMSRLLEERGKTKSDSRIVEQLSKRHLLGAHPFLTIYALVHILGSHPLFTIYALVLVAHLYRPILRRFFFCPPT